MGGAADPVGGFGTTISDGCRGGFLWARSGKELDMARNSMSGAEARRFVLIGRTAGIALGVTAAALWALEIPGMGTLPAKPEVKPPAAAEQPATIELAKLDSDAVMGLSERLDLAGHVTPPPVEPTITTAPPPPPTGPEWKYLGAIVEADRKMAVISVNDRQKILREGKSYGDTKLLSVSPEAIEIEGPGGKQRIDKSERRPGMSVAWLKNLPPNTPAAGMANNAPNMGANMAGNRGANMAGQLSPEMRQRLTERGINPEETERWRQAMRDRRNRARGADPNGGGPGTPGTISNPRGQNGDTDAAGAQIKVDDAQGVQIINNKTNSSETIH
jgi:hypothetical protein